MNSSRVIALNLMLVLAGLAGLSSMGSAQAGEGNSSTSVGHGIKCRMVAFVQPDGRVIYKQVCSKGV